MAGIEVESNQMRRSHRVNVPIHAIIDKTLYTCKDWSLTGIGVSELKEEYTPDSIIEASLLLKFTEARLEIPVNLKFRASRNGISGFEFVDLSESNRRVLREYLELSIEGRLENADGLLSIYNEPIIDSPIKESVTLSDAEETKLSHAYKKRAGLYMGLGVMLFFLIITTIYYNVQYVYRSIGVISGNFIKISPTVSGKISKINVKVGDRVEPNTLLFELDENAVIDKIDIIDEKLNLLNGDIKTTTNTTLVNLLHSDYKESSNKYKKMNELYSRHMVTSTELLRVKEKYQRDKVRYLQEQDKYASRNNSRSILALKTEMELRKAELLNTLRYLRVSADNHGSIYAIKSNIGNHVGSGDEVVVLQTNDQPYVVCKVYREEALSIQTGMKAEVYIPSLDQTVLASVETLGNLSINTESMISNEVSLREVTVKLSFIEPIHSLPLNERVKIWFYKPLLG
ncbi:MAG: biotin/lipoyl-binding protein [Campylobacterota bacterium]|nr:biotin/lipoyl-binding protein [Campylobacterota bacterium]